MHECTPYTYCVNIDIFYACIYVGTHSQSIVFVDVALQNCIEPKLTQVHSGRDKTMATAIIAII